MSAVSFTILGRLPGWARVRVDTRGNYPRFFTGKKTRDGENIVRVHAKKAMSRERLKPFSGPVELCVTIFLNPPESWSKKKREAAKFVTGKPDADNILKLIGDAMNRVVYRDDSQIASVHFVRVYTLDTECVRIDISGAST